MSALQPVQNRQRMSRGTARWIQRFCVAICSAARLGGDAATALQLSHGVTELEGLHASVADSLAQLRAAFGDVLATRYREATMYLDLRDLKLENPALVSVMITG